MQSTNVELAKCHVAIVGLGLMGGSLAMALRGKCASVIGIDTDQETLELAGKKLLVDKLSDKLDEGISEADLVILCTPIKTIITLLGKLPLLHQGGPVVIDIGSTKRAIMQEMQSLPERFDPVGGHPMCGKEHSTLRNASAGLFTGATFAFTPIERTSHRAKTLAEELAHAVLAEPYWLDAELHDQWVASTSHLPYLLANSLVAITPLESTPLVGPGYRSTSRLAPTPFNMMGDILETNRDNIVIKLGQILQRLDMLENILRNGDMDELASRLAEGASSYQSLTKENR